MRCSCRGKPGCCGRCRPVALATLAEALQSVDDDKQAERNRMVLRLGCLVRQEPERASVVLRLALVSELANTFVSIPNLALQMLEYQAVSDFALEIVPHIEDGPSDQLIPVFGGGEKRLAFFSQAYQHHHKR